MLPLTGVCQIENFRFKRLQMFQKSGLLLVLEMPTSQMIAMYKTS